MIGPGFLLVVLSTSFLGFTDGINKILSQNCLNAQISGKKIHNGVATLKNEWNEGFDALITFTVPEKINGWRIILTLSKSVKNFRAWKAESKASSGKRFVLSNKPWNKKLQKRAQLKLSFLAQKSGSTPQVCADLIWISDTLPVTNILATTSPPVATKSMRPSKPDPATMPPTWRASYNYNELLHKSILFYEAQRSGKLPTNNRIPWRGDSALGDKGNDGEDLTGGWYDAGDFVKFGYPMAFSTTLLSWGLIEYRNAYAAAGELQTMLDSIKWPLDYFIKAHVKKNVLYGQVGKGEIDHAYWGRPEDMTMPRPAYKIDTTKPGSDLAAETAAAMAAGSIVFRSSNPTYADVLLKHSKELYQFADQFRGIYSDSITDASHFYKSTKYEDELVWGAAWLYKATRDNVYLEKAEQYFSHYHLGYTAWGFSWDEKIAGLQMLLYELTKKDVYKNAIEKSLNVWLPGGGVHYTPKGLAWRSKWASNRYAANTAFLALLAADKGLRSSAYRQFGEKQIHYMLGDSGRSYVVGFGKNPPTHPHHRSSSCPNRPAPCNWNNYNNPGPNPQVLYGALVGGPDQNDFYEDKRSDYVKNEVACDYNVGFQSALAALKSNELALSYL